MNLPVPHEPSPEGAREQALEPPAQHSPVPSPVRSLESATTVAAYDAHAEAYAAGLLTPDDAYLAGLDHFAAALPPGASVLEVGSGSGRDALLLEARGLGVQRTDISRGFVERMRSAGHDAWVLDPLVDDLRGPWDAIYASASLLHARRVDLPVILTRLRAATRDAGVLLLDLKEGDGEAWSTHGSIPLPRHFTYWREAPLRMVLALAGWEVRSVDRYAGRKQSNESWFHVFAGCA